MSKIDRQPEACVAVAEVPISDLHAVAYPSRRRIIKLGASAVPVLATLTSQSALAGQCISTSAWGSAQISNTASEAARHPKYDVTTGYTISAWTTNDSANAAWTAFKAKYPTYTNAIHAGQPYFDPSKLTFGDLYGIVDHNYMRDPSSLGFNLANKVIGHFLTSDDKGYFLVAMLNYAVGAKPPTECVTDANWLLIVAGTYPPAGTPWDVHQIRLYLDNNYIVQA